MFFACFESEKGPDNNSHVELLAAVSACGGLQLLPSGEGALPTEPAVSLGSLWQPTGAVVFVVRRPG